MSSITDAPDYPWAEDAEFCAQMRIVERRHPLGPSSTIVRRFIWWKITRSEQWSLWDLPEDPLTPEDWMPEIS